MAKRVVIYGASGFIGKGLAQKLSLQGYEVLGVSRKGQGNITEVSKWYTPQTIDLSGCEAVINLAGEPIDQRWTIQKKQEFHASRVGITHDIILKISELTAEKRPHVLINGSAVGFYPDAGDRVIHEDCGQGVGYLSELCRDWEHAAKPAEELGVRAVFIRIGVVLGQDGRAFQKLLTVFRLGIGGRLGSGKQWMPWIHVEDLREAIVFCVQHESINGPVNGSAPHPETNINVTRKLALALGRWVFLPVPGFALKIAFGAFGEYLLNSQRVIPKMLLDAGFKFQFPTLDEALRDLVQPKQIK